VIAEKYRYEVVEEDNVLVVYRNRNPLLTVVLKSDKIIFISLGGFRVFERDHQEFALEFTQQLANALDGMVKAYES
jgi:hypothetical protein